MPHISINGIEKRDFDAVYGKIQTAVSEIVSVEREKVVLEYAPAPLYVCDRAADWLVTAHIWWKRRPANMQKEVAYAIGEIIKTQTGRKTVKVKYVNLGPDDLYDV